jgi:hypothetical protein
MASSSKSGIVVKDEPDSGEKRQRSVYLSRSEDAVFLEQVHMMEITDSAKNIQEGLQKVIVATSLQDKMAAWSEVFATMVEKDQLHVSESGGIGAATWTRSFGVANQENGVHRCLYSQQRFRNPVVHVPRAVIMEPFRLKDATSFLVPFLVLDDPDTPHMVSCKGFLRLCELENLAVTCAGCARAFTHMAM